MEIKFTVTLICFFIFIQIATLSSRALCDDTVTAPTQTTTSSSLGEELKPLRRWAVLPFFLSDSHLKRTIEETWSKCRQQITAHKQYLVASKQLLIEQDYFQPRKKLSPEEVETLASRLNVDVLVTGYVQDRELTVNVYLAQNKKLFWSKTIGFQSGLRADDQLEVTTEKIIRDLLNDIPYQGFVIIDPLIGKSVFDEGDKKITIVDLGNTDNINGDEDVQFVKVYLPKDNLTGANDSPQQEQLKLAVVAEGKVSKIRRGVINVEIEKTVSLDQINERLLVRLPKHMVQKLSSEILPTAIKPLAPEASSGHKFGAIIGGILSAVGIALIAL